MRTIRFFLLAFSISFFFSSSAAPLDWVVWPSPPKVALTFDDGPHPGPTAMLCGVLAHYKVPATFFIVGRVAAAHPEVLRELALAGHEICNHTWNHLDVRLISPQAMRQELDQTRMLIQSVTGQRTFLFRTPGGTEAFLRRSFQVPSGYRLVLWNVHSLDQEGLPPRRIAERVLSQIRNGDVVLMHNGLKNTRDALEIIIPALKNRGYEFVKVSDLLHDQSHSFVSSRRSAFLQG